ncbi:MAG: YafY family protein [Pseudomonadota bacterium]
MRRADRLLQIVQYLRGGRLTTAHMLADRLEVSERTIYRDIATLQSTGVPIDGEAGVGYVMDEGYDVPPLMFTRDEIVALVAGARMLKAWGGAAMAHGAEEALVKIEAVLPDAARDRARSVPLHAISVEMSDELRVLLDRLEAAAEARLRLELAYRDKEDAASVRVVRPLGLWFWGKVWTLVSWCELRADFRMFRVDRIVEMREGERFAPERDKSLAAFYRQMEACGVGPSP